MYKTTANRFKGTKKEYLMIREISSDVQKLKKTANYKIRQKYFEDQTYLNYNSLDKLMKEENNFDYRRCHSQVAQQTLKTNDKSWKSFFELHKLKKSGKYTRPISIPGYQRGKTYSVVSLQKDSYKIVSRGEKENRKKFLRISLSKSIQEKYEEKFLYVKLSSYLLERITKLKYVEIVPKQNGLFFNIHFIFKNEESLEQVPNTSEKDLRVLAIDIGINNLLAMIDTVTGKSVLVSGKKIKSINRHYNKMTSKAKSELKLKLKEKISSAKKSKKDSQSVSTKKIKHMWQKRQNKITDELHQISRKVINYCLENGLNEIVIGKNKEWKTNCNMGKKMNQKFVQIPHARLIDMIKNKADMHGITVITQEESYTSKCDALSLEEICKHKQYLGRRVKRGLFKSGTGKFLNADINGALNILRKCKGDEVDLWILSLASIGCVTTLK
jgi:putative transposase